MRKKTACHALVLICLGGFIAEMAFTGNVCAAGGNPHAVATFECLGIYYKVENDLGECALRYRKTGTEEWKDVMGLWFDKRDSEYRGSIIGLAPDTEYEISLRCAGKKTVFRAKGRTWEHSKGEGRRCDSGGRRLIPELMRPGRCNNS